MHSGAQAVGQASFGEGSGRIWLSSVACRENEKILMNCTFVSSGNNSCTHAQDAGVRCQPGKTISHIWVPLLLLRLGCLEGDIRLLEGSNELEGRVSMCKSNMWGTLCSTAWSWQEAQVVCRQLGRSTVGKLVALFEKKIKPSFASNLATFRLWLNSISPKSLNPLSFHKLILALRMAVKHMFHTL